jgi:hypothetical protein
LPSVICHHLNTQQARQLYLNDTHDSKACEFNHGHVNYSYSAQRAQSG